MKIGYSYNLMAFSFHILNKNRLMNLKTIALHLRFSLPLAVYPFLFILIISFNGQASNKMKSIPPVNKNASAEAKNLLSYLYSISGEYTLTGQHNFLGEMSIYTDSIYNLTGKYPAIWGCDFGFSDSTHDIDNIKYRPLLVKEIKKQHERGSIITMTYHQANPVIG
jgi:hypothetical protein